MKGGVCVRRLAVFVVAAVGALVAVPAIPAVGQGGDVLVSNGSPPTPFSENKQNEPAIAVDANHPNILAAGSNDEIDEEACNAGADNTCPFTDGIGVSGIYFSTDSGHTWTQPTYRGLTARNCQGVPDTPTTTDPDCTPEPGPIGTLPRYFGNGLVADGDPALAFGPRPVNGEFSWENGSRLYYANLTSKLDANAFKGFEAIGVSRTDNIAGAIAGRNRAWKKPVIASKQNSALFADKEQIWADNAESSQFFGHVYVCYGAFQGLPGRSQPLKVLTSTDGGSSWTQHQVGPATNNPSSHQGFGHSGCTIRTDSTGVVYVFYYQFAFGFPGEGKQLLAKSFDGGAHWTRPRTVQTAFDLCNAFEPSIGRCVQDGIAGARNDLGPDPSVDIANGAPTGEGATDEIVLTWVDGRDGLNHEHVMFTNSLDGGSTWADTRQLEQPNTDDPVEQPLDRGYYSAPAISPNGTDVYLVYNANTTPFRNNTTEPRGLIGVVLHASVDTEGTVGDFTQIHRGLQGDPRGSSQNNLAAEFLGDYVYAVSQIDPSTGEPYGAAVWNDTRNAEDCPAIDLYRQRLHDFATGESSTRPTAPAVQQECPPTFGNSDIFGFTTAA
jgi:hypothetical protein